MNQNKPTNVFQKIIQNRNNHLWKIQHKRWVAILDIKPQGDRHYLFISRELATNLTQLDQKTWLSMCYWQKRLVSKLSRSGKIEGFYLHTNIGWKQEVPHMHTHLVIKFH